MAHLTQFCGTDNLEGYMLAMDDYDANDETLAFSVPAAEHSTIMAWGKERESEAIEHIMDVNKDYPIVSIVSDTYDLGDCLTSIWGGSLYEKVKNSKNRNVPRPDSGKPVDIVLKTLRSLWGRFGGTTNAQGFKVLPNNLRVLQGDGVNLYSIFQILNAMREAGFAAENIVFGMGGALLQKCDRDTYAFAMKLSAIKRKGEDKWIGVKKTVATDSKKQSAAGRFYVAYTGPLWHTMDLDTLETGEHMDRANMLQTVWNGHEVLRRQTFDEIRNLTSAV